MIAVLEILEYVLYIYSGFMSFDIILSWIPKAYDFKIFQVIHRISDFYMAPFHGALVIGFLDFTPMIGLGIYSFILSAFSYLFF